MSIMNFFVQVKPNAKQNSVKKIEANHFAVSVKQPAQEGKANQAVIELMAEYLDISKSTKIGRAHV